MCNRPLVGLAPMPTACVKVLEALKTLAAFVRARLAGSLSSGMRLERLAGLRLVRPEPLPAKLFEGLVKLMSPVKV